MRQLRSRFFCVLFSFFCVLFTGSFFSFSLLCSGSCRLSQISQVVRSSHLQDSRFLLHQTTPQRSVSVCPDYKIIEYAYCKWSPTPNVWKCIPVVRPPVDVALQYHQVHTKTQIIHIFEYVDKSIYSIYGTLRKIIFFSLSSSPSAMAKDSTNKRATGVYEPVPVIKQSTILGIGFGIFLLANLWPPLILLVAYVVSLLVPYSFRTNDDATSRRRLYREFRTNECVSSFLGDDIVLDESYWVNRR